MKTILSLFDYSGTWSEPYREAGYKVLQYDLKFGPGNDILTLDFNQFKNQNVVGILAAPPCTHFTKASSLNWAFYDKAGLTNISIELVKRVLYAVKLLYPKFWAIENPPGRIEKLIPEMRNLKLLSFYPYEFGTPTYKLTNLYGNFNPFLFRNFVKPIYKIKAGKNELDFLKLHKPGYCRGSRRSVTPTGFAQSFFNSNH